MMKLKTLACCCVAVAGTVTLSAQSSQTTTTTDVQAVTPAIETPRISPRQHLTDAQGMLADVSDKSLSASAQRNFSQLVRDFSALTSSFAEAQPQTATWELPMYDVERDLVRLIGGGGPRLTDDRDTIPGLPAQVADAQTRTTLEAFRTDVELFYDAATTRGPGGVTPPRSAAAALF